MASSEKDEKDEKEDYFHQDGSFKVDESIGSATISPSGRDVALASREGLYIIDLEDPFSPPRHLPYRSQWEVADVQWSPFAARDSWIVSTSNQKALVWNLDLPTTRAPIQHVLHAHDRAITDINFSAHDPDMLATCSIDSFIYCWDLRQRDYQPTINFKHDRPAGRFSDWKAGATQVKWSRVDANMLASSHGSFLHIWDRRKGAVPLQTIEAHPTAIYGLDWNRTDVNKILTCSLDGSMKFWDINNPGHPERVIVTQYPIMRARHTPFGRGVIAMPQRGNSELHMYDRRYNDRDPVRAATQPVHSFGGHTGNVKEFLWRFRGDIDQETSIDDREFQLVSWGKDGYLRLHHIDPSILETVGHVRGSKATEFFKITRRNAPYRTFHEEKPKHELPPPPAQMRTRAPSSQGLLTSQLAAAGKSRLPLTPTRVASSLESKQAGAGMQVRTAAKKVINPIKWMEGVNIGKRENRSTPRKKRASSSETLPTWREPEDLADEIKHVGTKYKQITLEEHSIPERTATFTLSGPWATDGKLAFLRVHFKFPNSYPRKNPPEVHIEKTTSSVSQGTIAELDSAVKAISQNYAIRKIGCLEAIIALLLGERDLTDSISWLVDDDISEADLDLMEIEDSSSDDEDVGGGLKHGQDLESSGTDILRPINANTNVPLPKQCGAYWAENGTLVVFFPPKQEPQPMFSLAQLRNDDAFAKSNGNFANFGRFHTEPRSRRRVQAIDSDDEDDTDLSTTSSSSDSDLFGAPGRFVPSAAWRHPTLRFQPPKEPHRNAVPPVAINRKSIVALHDLKYMLPARRELAEDYRIYGDGPEVCDHNARVARTHGRHDAADTWELAALILNDKVPLEIMNQTHRKEPVLVLAKRSLVRIQRKDSGLDLAFDEAEAATHPLLRSRVKWGQHLMAQSLILDLFHHYETAADVQMLAMLSCIFEEPAARDAAQLLKSLTDAPELPMSMKAPAFALDYFPSQEVAWSLFRPTFSMPPSPASNRTRTLWDGADKRLDTYGSYGSSNGPWGNHTPDSDQGHVYSTGTTPPGPTLANRRHGTLRATAPSSISTSPELNHHTKRSNSNLANAFANLQRNIANATSTSPPTNSKARETELSTSAPSSNITWGANTFYSSSDATNATARSRKSRHGSTTLREGAFDEYEELLSGGSAFSDEEDVPGAPSRASGAQDESGITVKLKNQDKFDDEGSLSIPLLDKAMEWKFKAWRELYADQLTIWNLPIQRAEVLKFNGLASYWPVDDEEARKPSNANILGISADIPTTALHRPSEDLDPKKRAERANSAAFRFNPEAAAFVPLTHSPLIKPTKLPGASEIDRRRLTLQISALKGDAYFLTVEGPGSVDPYPQTPASLGSGSPMDSSFPSNMATEGESMDVDRTCSVCWMKIDGLYVLCDRCEHVGHVDHKVADDGATGTGACEVGCGCNCIDEDVDVVGDEVLSPSYGDGFGSDLQTIVTIGSGR